MQSPQDSDFVMFCFKPHNFGPDEFKKYHHPGKNPIKTTSKKPVDADWNDESIGNHVFGIVWYSVVHPQLCLLDSTTH